MDNIYKFYYLLTTYSFVKKNQVPTLAGKHLPTDFIGNWSIFRFAIVIK